MKILTVSLLIILGSSHGIVAAQQKSVFKRQFQNELQNRRIAIIKNRLHVPRDNWLKPVELRSILTNNGENILHVAVAARDQELADLAISQIKIPVDSKNSMGKTSLQCAVEAEDIGMIIFLLRYGANIQQLNQQGKTLYDATDHPQIKAFMQISLRDSSIIHSSHMNSLALYKK